MKNVKQIFSAAVALAMLICTFSIFGVSAENTAGEYAPKADAFTVQNNVILTDVEGGLSVKMSDSKVNTDRAISKDAYTLDGLHLKLENITTNGTITLTFTAKNNVDQKYTDGVPVEILTAGGVQYYNGFHSFRTLVSNGDNSVKDATSLDILFEKTDDGWKFTINNEVVTMDQTDSEYFDLVFADKKSYVMFEGGNGNEDVISKEYTVTALHNINDVKEPDNGEGDEPPAFIEDDCTGQFIPKVEDVTKQNNVTLTDTDNGLFVQMPNSNVNSDRFITKKAYTLDGLHLRIERLTADGPFTLILTKYDSVDQGYVTGRPVEFMLDDGIVRYFDGGDFRSLVVKGDNSIKDATTLDIYFEKVDGAWNITMNDEVVNANDMYADGTEQFDAALENGKCHILFEGGNADSIVVSKEFYITALHSSNDVEISQGDIDAANAVMEKITTIGDEVTLDSEKDILAAEEAYAALSDAQKALVTNYSDLIYARTVLNALKESTPVNPGQEDPESKPESEETNKSPATNVNTASCVVLMLLVVLSGAVVLVSRKRKA